MVRNGGSPRRAAVGEPRAVVLFHTSSHALRAEALLAARGVAAKLIPVPRQLSSDCGVCLRIARADGAVACEVIAGGGVEIVGIHDA
ncbi:MAG: DUF3343 domain-containing protein [Candidatus Eisenbacteria sp.]|nr:DUF3343 domain-containing protein [Candidatus Eisenbacteria bacterium]